MSEVSSVFNIKQESKCIPKYQTLTHIPIVRDLENHPEDVNKTANWFRYESGFVGGGPDDANTTTAGFILPNHTMRAVADSNATHPAYLHNETAKLYFANADHTDCDYDKCELMAAGCAWPYTQTKYLEMSKDFPWDITARTDVVEGYNTTYCVKCSNAWDSIEQDDIVFT